jgi:hypothetical protein
MSAPWLIVWLLVLVESGRRRLRLTSRAVAPIDDLGFIDDESMTIGGV